MQWWKEVFGNKSTWAGAKREVICTYRSRVQVKVCDAGLEKAESCFAALWQTPAANSI